MTVNEMHLHFAIGNIYLSSLCAVTNIDLSVSVKF